MKTKTDLPMRSKGKRQQADYEFINIVLSLVLTKPPSISILKKQSKENLSKAEKWAVKAALRASDNPVRVPSKPKWLEKYN